MLGAKLKSLGLRPGAVDLLLYYPTKTFHGLWLEVKRNKKYTKSERTTATWLRQEKFIEDVKSVGFAGDFCYGWEDGKRIVEEYLLT